MTKDRACANDGTRPVSLFENSQAKGHALCAEHMWRKHKDEVKSLRNRQAAYLDSLPTDPQEACQAAMRLMEGGHGYYPEGFEMARHLSCALEAMIKHSDTYYEGPERDAAIYLADQAAQSMMRVTEQLDRIADILGNPGRVKRESA